MMTGTLETLNLFERDCVNSYLKEKAESEKEKVEKKILDIEEK